MVEVCALLSALLVIASNASFAGDSGKKMNLECACSGIMRLWSFRDGILSHLIVSSSYTGNITELETYVQSQPQRKLGNRRFSEMLPRRF